TLFRASILMHYISPPPPLFFLHISDHHRDLHSFPTRRSSDLPKYKLEEVPKLQKLIAIKEKIANFYRTKVKYDPDSIAFKYFLRSEEHTSELQSRFDLVCRLLLEKKKKNN